MKTKRILRMFGLLGLASVTAPSIVLADETSDKIAELRKLRENIPLLHLVGSMVTRAGGGNRESRVELWEKINEGKQRLRREVTAKTDAGTPNEQTQARSLMVKDGETAWRESNIEAKKLVVKGKAELRTEYDEMDPVLKKGVAKIGPTDSLLGQPCVLLEVRDKDKPEEIIASYWISTKNGIVMRSVLDSPGDTVTEFKVTELNMDDSFSNHLFDYKPPGDAQVIENPGGGKKGDK